MSGRNGTFRDWLAGTHPDAIILEPEHCDEAIIGVTYAGQVVYGYDELCESYARQFRPDAESDDDAYQMAVDWVEYNTLRSLPYCGSMRPVVAAYDPEKEVLVDATDFSDDPEELVFRSDCPGLEA